MPPACHFSSRDPSRSDHLKPLPAGADPKTTKWEDHFNVGEPATSSSEEDSGDDEEKEAKGKDDDEEDGEDEEVAGGDD